MKSSRLIAGLLGLNLALFVGILAYFLRTQMGAPLAPLPEEASPAPRVARPPAPEPLTVTTNDFRWGQLESEDYKEYVARLRAIGCPEQTLRELIVADLDKLMAPELRAACGRRAELKYWDSEDEEMANDVDPREVARRARDIELRKRDIIRELVHADLARERMQQTGQEDLNERRLAFLPEDRRTQVREMLEQFEDAEARLRTKDLDEGESLNFAEREQLRVLREQREAQLNALLTPAQREQFDLWLSPTANAIRHALYGMHATEQEFIAIYRARKAFDDRWSASDVVQLDGHTEQQRETERLHVETAIHQSLGEARYAEFKRGEDEDYHRLNALTTRYNLPREKAVEAFGYKKTALDYRAQIQADTSLNPQQKAEALKAISEETERALRGLLGDKPFRYYIRSGQGGWVHE